MHLGTHGLPPTSIDHIAYVVKDLEATVGFFRNTLGVAPWSVPRAVDSDTHDLEGPHFRVLFSSTVVGGVSIDVIQPLEDDPTFGGFVEKTGGGLHHVCFSPAWCGEEAREAIRSQPGVTMELRGALAGKCWEYYTHADLPGITIEFGDPGEHLPAYRNVE